jgi:SAM-dependent methyltransferase
MSWTNPMRALRTALRSLYRRILPHLPSSARQWLKERRLRWAVFPPYGFVRFGSFHRLTPISHDVASRGTAIDRYYIDRFIKRHAGDIHGRVLECYELDYVTRFGAERVTRSDVLNIELDNPNSTFTGDLAGINDLPSDAFDCIIITQVFQFIYDLRAAIATLQRIAKPGGVILATMPGITPVHFDQWPWMWSLTTVSAERLFQEYFPANGISVEAHGNILTAIAFLHGLGCEELKRADLDYDDPRFAVTIAVRAVKSTAL